MTPSIQALRHSCTALAAAGALASVLPAPIGSAAAQTTTTTTTHYGTTTVEQMTIVAPHVQHRILGRTTTGIPVEELSLSRAVDYSDLNLASRADIRRLDYRIRRAANAACSQPNGEYPEALYPSYQSSDLGCVAQATNEGRAQARMVIAQANGYPPSE